MAKEKRLTPNQAEQAKELARLKRFVKGAEKRGYTFPASAIPAPKTRVTKKDLERLRSLTPSALYEMATARHPETGATISGTAYRTIERREAALKGHRRAKINAGVKRALSEMEQARGTASYYSIPRISDNVLRHVLHLIESWQPKQEWERDGKYNTKRKFSEIKRQDKNTLTNILSGAISREGKDTVAFRMQSDSIEIHELAWAILYGKSGDKKDGVQPDLLRFAEIIQGSKPTQAEAQEIAAAYGEEDVDTPDID